METTLTENKKNVAAAIHLSTFSKYIFPFGNFIVPLILWTQNKDNDFVDDHGKEAINFQLSVFIYTLIIGIISLPFVLIFASDFISLINTLDHTAGPVSFQEIKNVSEYIAVFFVAIILLFGIFVFELYAVISATMQAAKGKLYKYPFSISFIKTTSLSEVQGTGINQSKNEQFS